MLPRNWGSIVLGLHLLLKVVPQVCLSPCTIQRVTYRVTADADDPQPPRPEAAAAVELQLDGPDCDYFSSSTYGLDDRTHDRGPFKDIRGSCVVTVGLIVYDRAGNIRTLLTRTVEIHGE